MLRDCVLCIAAASVLFVGCPGNDDSSPDAGASVGGAGASGSKAGTGGTTGAAGSGGSSRLQSGTYEASNVHEVSDGCGLTLDDGTFETTEIVNTGTELSIGKKYDSTTDPKWDPSGYGLGSGEYTTATTATLTVSTHATITDDGCAFDVERTTKVTYTGDNAVSVDYTDKESNQNSKCSKSNFESTADCTSHYTFNLTRQD